MEDWKQHLVAQEQLRAYNERVKQHNLDIDTELHELDTIVKYDMSPEMPIDKAQRAIMLSQIRLLRKQWESMRIE